ncbi:MAG: hypothetical protein E6I32_08920 [Chloroflexi bacterium]|nr:MAG: hypothetical protein E6I32_08920 [Chloroflexota bacterium]
MIGRNQREEDQGETGYSWFSFNGGCSQVVRLLFTFIVIGAGIAFYIWYSRNSDDASPDSIAGYGYAIVGTLFVVLAGILFSRRRRSHKGRAIGQLHASLQWHVCFALAGLVFLFLHSFGNFNARTGTYALYGMIALAISGVVGRTLDRLMPRFIAGEVHKALTAQGEDRVESISEKLQAIVIHNTQDVQGFTPAGEKKPASTSLISLSGGPLSNHFPFEYKNQPLHTPWDLAYISLEATPQELSRDEGHYRFIPDKKSELARPGALMPGAQEHMSELREVERAMQREQYYRYVIRYWRAVHVLLVLITLGLTTWHLVYAAQLLLPTLMHR